MNSTPALRLALIATAATLALPAFAAVEIARGELIVSATGRLTYDTNVQGFAFGDEDTLFSLGPELRWERSAGRGRLSARAGLFVNRYQDLDQFDSEDVTAEFTAGLPVVEGSASDGMFRLSYADVSDIEETVGTRVRSKTFDVGFNGTWKSGPRTAWTTSAGYRDTSRNLFADRRDWRAGLGFAYDGFLGGAGLQGNYNFADTQSTNPGPGNDLDQRSHTVSTGLYYRLLSGVRVSGSVGYRWLDRDLGETTVGQRSINKPVFTVAVDGPFLPPARFPKLESRFRIGYETGEVVGLNDTGSQTLVGELGLKWQARERTALSIDLSRSQELSADNFSGVFTRARIGVDQQVGYHVSLRGGLGYEWSDYRGTTRSDDTLTLDLSASYAIDKYWSLGASFRHYDRESDSLFRTYDRQVLSVYGSYAF